MRPVFLIFVLALGLASCGGPPEPTQPAEPIPPPAAAPAAAAQPPAVKAGWVVQDMRTPESAYLDEGSGYLFVSQIDGHRTRKTARAASRSSGSTARWSPPTGLRASTRRRGCAASAATLWVADIDEVIGIDIASAKENARVKIDGAMFLNDVAVGADGTVYVSDMLGSQDLRDQGREGDGLCGRGTARISERPVRRGRTAHRRRLGQ